MHIRCASALGVGHGNGEERVIDKWIAMHAEDACLSRVEVEIDVRSDNGSGLKTGRRSTSRHAA